MSEAGFNFERKIGDKYVAPKAEISVRNEEIKDLRKKLSASEDSLAMANRAIAIRCAMRSRV